MRGLANSRWLLVSEVGHLASKNYRQAKIDAGQASRERRKVSNKTRPTEPASSDPGFNSLDPRRDSIGCRSVWVMRRFHTSEAVLGPSVEAVSDGVMHADFVSVSS